MSKSADLFIDGYIGRDNGDSIFGGEKTFGLSNLNDFISSLNSDITNVNVHINSGGGSVDEGFAIHDKLKASPYSITTIAEGMVGSIATVIFLAGEERKMFKNSKFFIHNPYLPEAYGLDASKARDLADSLANEENKILSFYSEVTGKKTSEIKPFMDADTSFTAEQAIDMGFATSIVEKEVKNQKEYKLVAYINNNNNFKKEEQMKKEEQISWFKKIEGLINKIKPVIKNEKETTKEGVAIYFDGKLDVGTKVFADELMTTPLADGTITIGSVEYIIKNGVVESMKDSSMNELEALKMENESLKAEIALSKELVDAVEEKRLITEATVTELNNEIVNFKKIVFGTPAPQSSNQPFFKEKKESGKLDGVLLNMKSRYGKK